MPRIVDGDNLLGSWPGRRRSDAARRQLAGEVFRFRVRERRRVVLVFDGPAPPVPPPADEVHFSGPGRSADEWILGFLRGERDPRSWIVVTNDRPLADQSRYLGARVERCGRFRERLTAVGEGEKPDGTVDLDDWLRYFGSDDESD